MCAHNEKQLIHNINMDSITEFSKLLDTALALGNPLIVCVSAEVAHLTSKLSSFDDPNSFV